MHAASVLAVSALNASALRSRLRGQRVDDLSRPRIVQLLASLMFNRIRVVLQSLDMPLQQLVLPLQAVQLAIQALRILPLLLIGRKSVLSEDDVIPQSNRNQCSCTRGDLAPARVTSFIQTGEHARLFAFHANGVGTSHLPLSTKLRTTDGQVENPLNSWAGTNFILALTSSTVPSREYAARTHPA